MPRCPSTSLNYYFFRYWSGLDLYMTSFYIRCSKLQRMMIPWECLDRKLYGHNQTSSWKQQNFTLALCSMLMRTYVAIGPLFYRPSSGIPNAFLAWLQQISEGCGNLTKGWNIPNAMGKSFENGLCFMESQNVSHLFQNFLAGSLLRWPNEPCTCNNKLRVCGQWPIFDTICNCFMMLQCLTCFGSNSDENDHSIHPLFGTRSIMLKVATRWWRIFWKNSYAQSLFTATNGACGCFWKLCINARLQWGRSPCICIMPVCHCQVMPTRNFNLSVASSSNVWRWTPTPCISSPRPCAWTWRSRRQPRRMSLERSAQRCHLRGELG